MNKPHILFIISLSLSTTAFADKHKNCEDFHIQISNQTGVACILTEQNVEYGLLTTPPPTSIIPNDSKRFDMEQTFYGPSIILSYQCGADIIRFQSSQEFCGFFAGAIYGKTLTPTSPNLDATPDIIPGSTLWDKGGSINWSLLPHSN